MEEEQQSQERTWSPAKFRQRVVGASVVVALAVLVLPVWLDGSGIDTLDIQHAPAAPQIERSADIDVPKPDADASAVLESDPEELTVTESTEIADRTAAMPAQPTSDEPEPRNDSHNDQPGGQEDSQKDSADSRRVDQAARTEPSVEPAEQLAQAEIEQPAPQQPTPSDDAQTDAPAHAAEPTEPTPDTSSQQSESTTAMASATDGHQYILQLGSFSDELNAKGLVENIEQNGFEAFVEPLFSEHGTVWRVRLGPYASRDQANQAAENLRERIGRDGLIMRYD